MKTEIKKNLSKLTIVAALVAMVSTMLSAQDPLDGYIAEGLRSNLVIQQKNLSLKQAEQSLQIARSYFLPAVNLLADYTSGEGGRSIAIPVGDLLNPVYTSLNQLTQNDAFPQIDNVNQNFFPKNFYDGRIRTSVPLFNTDLYSNKTIQGQQIAMKQHEVSAYRRLLVLDIKSAYFQYLSAVAETRILESALALVNRNVAVNESLLKNGKALPANFLRSKSEAENVKAALNSADNRVANAKRYFNFLLNRDPDAEIDVNFTANEVALADTTSLSVEGREELQMIRTLKGISQSTLRMNKLARLPKVNAFLDLGSQASDWEWNQNSMYYLFGVQLSIPIFQGMRNATTIRQSENEVRKNELNLTHSSQQLALAAQIARNDLHTAIRNYSASHEQLKSARSYFNLIDKGYQQGVNSLIEFLDARNQLTSSQLQQNLKLFGMLTASAKLEYETASYTF